MCARFKNLKDKLDFVLIGSLGITLFGLLLAFSVPEKLPQFSSIMDFTTYKELWPTFVSLVLLGASTGLYVVPLYVRIQQVSELSLRSQVIAALNIQNSVFMVGSALVGILSLSVLSMTIPQLFLMLAVGNIAFTIKYTLSPVRY